MANNSVPAIGNKPGAEQSNDWSLEPAAFFAGPWYASAIKVVLILLAVIGAIVAIGAAFMTDADAKNASYVSRLRSSLKFARTGDPVAAAKVMITETVEVPENPTEGTTTSAIRALGTAR